MIAASQMQILQSILFWLILKFSLEIFYIGQKIINLITIIQKQIGLFQHALQFIPEQSDPVDFFEMYFDEAQTSKANRDQKNEMSKPSGNFFNNKYQNQDIQTIQPSNQGKLKIINQSQSSAGFGMKDQNPMLQGNGISKGGNKFDSNDQQNKLNESGNIKKITVKKLQGSHSQQNALLNDKDFKQVWKTKLSPIKQPKMQMVKLSQSKDPFNLQKDGFFHLPGGTANKNLRSNSNYQDNIIGSNHNHSYSKQNQQHAGNYNLDQSHNQPHHHTESYQQNQSQFSMYDPGSKYNPNPYAVGWANAILKEHYQVSLKRVDEKNGRKRWIIRKLKNQKDGQDQHSSVINTHGDKAGNMSSVVGGINLHHAGIIKPENKLKKQIKKSENIEGINDLFTNAFVTKQQQLISSSQPELLQFTELIETLNFDRDYIADNLLNQPLNEKNKNINEEEFEEYLQPYHEYVSQNLYQLPIYHNNFKKDLERVIFLNKLLIGNL